MDLMAVALVLLGIWAAGATWLAAVVGRGIRLRDEREVERG